MRSSTQVSNAGKGQRPQSDQRSPLAGQPPPRNKHAAVMRACFSAAALFLLSWLTLSHSAPATSALSRPESAPRLAYHWQDEFSAAEKAKLSRWLNETHKALEALVGELPFTTHLYMNRASAGEPVPWAHTERSSVQGVHFHVDPRFSLEEFRADWTAPHELSHLVLPYVGRNNSWFAEGFASYMQYQVMHQMGVLSKTAMRKRYQRNLDKAESRYRHDRQPFAQAANQLRQERNYPTMYWGGAAFFLQADTLLMERSSASLVATLKAYILCCRMKDHRLADVIAELDRLSGSNHLQHLLQTFKTQPGFPEHRGLDMGPSGSALGTVPNRVDKSAG